MRKTVLALAIGSLFLLVPYSGAETKTMEPTFATGEMVLLPGDVINQYTCGGEAPSETECSTGGHVRGGNGYILIGFPTAQPGFTGYLQANVYHDGGDVQFRCRWTDGAFNSCQVIGSIEWPALGAAFDYECNSYFNTGVPVVDSNLIANGIEGGVGPWSCLIQIDE